MVPASSKDAGQNLEAVAVAVTVGNTLSCAFPQKVKLTTGKLLPLPLRKPVEIAGQKCWRRQPIQRRAVATADAVCPHAKGGTNQPAAPCVHRRPENSLPLNVRPRLVPIPPGCANIASVLTMKLPCAPSVCDVNLANAVSCAAATSCGATKVSTSADLARTRPTLAAGAATCVAAPSKSKRQWWLASAVRVLFPPFG